MNMMILGSKIAVLVEAKEKLDIIPPLFFYTNNYDSDHFVNLAIGV